MIQMKRKANESITLHGVVIEVPYAADYVTLDRDGDVKVWFQCMKPYLYKNSCYHPSRHEVHAVSYSLGVLQDSSKTSEDFTPECIKL